MSKKILFTLSIVAVFAFTLSACSRFLIPNTGNQNQQLQQTAVMQTVSAMLTQQAFETLIAQATQIANQTVSTPIPQPTVVQASPTAVPPTPTATQVPPTPTATPKPLPCDAVQFVKDVTIPDGTVLASGQSFTKTWRLKNDGTCTWNKDYDLVFVDGKSMSAPAAVELPGTVKPGETVDISVELKAPSEQGSYKGNWMLRNASGKLFGLGGNQDKSFWVSITVSGFKSDSVPSPKYYYDYAAGICSADWYSNAGKISLPCSGISQNEAQWAAILMNPKFEGGRTEDERTIWMHLNKKDEWMQGFYPAQEIRSGDHFYAHIGCLEGNKDCNVQFSLDYKVDNGAVQNLGKWTEIYNGELTKIDLDLSQFAGKKVTLILGITNLSSSVSAEAFWLVPSIQPVSQ